MSRQTLPRGIRNHNPGNLEKGDPWQGLADDQSADPRFAVFEAPEWGIRAIARLLITYRDKHGVNTVDGIVNRWAPPSENDTESYALQLARHLDVDLHEPIDVTKFETAKRLVEAIIRHENGLQPYDALTINEGLRLAGIRPPTAAQREALEEVRPLGRTRTVRAGRAAEAAGGAALISGAIASVGDTLPVLREAAQLMRENAPGLLMLIGLAVVLSGGWILYARWHDREQGLR